MNDNEINNNINDNQNNNLNDATLINMHNTRNINNNLVKNLQKTSKVNNNLNDGLENDDQLVDKLTPKKLKKKQRLKDLNNIGRIIVPKKFFYDHIKMKKKTKLFISSSIDYWNKKLARLDGKEDPSQRDLKKMAEIHDLISSFNKFIKNNRSLEFIDFVNSNLLHKTVRFYNSHTRYGQEGERQTVKNLVIKTILPETVALYYNQGITDTFYIEIIKETLEVTDNRKYLNSCKKINQQLQNCYQKYLRQLAINRLNRFFVDDDASIDQLNRKEKYFQRFAYFPIKINFAEGGAHSNAGIVDFYKQEIIIIEPHITRTWDELLFNQIKKQLIYFNHFELKTLASESVPKFLQGNDNLCQTWSMYVTYLYLSRCGEFSLSFLLNTLGEKRIKNGLLEFIFYIYYQFKEEPEFSKFIKKTQTMTIKKKLIKNK